MHVYVSTNPHQPVEVVLDLEGDAITTPKQKAAARALVRKVVTKIKRDGKTVGEVRAQDSSKFH